MKILYVTSEAAPFCKPGGLGDVAGSLPAALAREGAEVAVACPLYRRVRERFGEQLNFECYDYVDLAWRHIYCGLFSMKKDGVINILLIGNDSRNDGEDGRSDAMILLSISTRTKKVVMTSLLRDMYVEIPDHSGNRLNAAYSYGGAELLLNTVEQNLGITVNRYVQVNFEAFANLVDAVGGVDLELSSGEKQLVNGYLNEYNELTGKAFGTDYLEDLSDGMVHLNGPQALAYTRNRYMGTDFGRTERQRKVLAEVVHRLPKALLHPRTLENGLLPNLTTNLTAWECYRLTLMAPFLLRYDMEHGSIPLEGTYRDGTIRKMAVLEVDLDANRKYLRALLYERKKENTEHED